jgi:hypothetical protein
MSGAAQDGPAGQGPPQSVQSVLDAFQASQQRAFDAMRTDLVAMVQAVEARTGQLELFVDGLKPGAGGGEQQSEALRQLRELWQADNERALTTLRGELQQAEARFEGDWPAGDKRVRDELRGELREVEQRVEQRIAAAMQEDRRATVIEGAEFIEHLLQQDSSPGRQALFDAAAQAAQERVQQQLQAVRRESREFSSLSQESSGFQQRVEEHQQRFDERLADLDRRVSGVSARVQDNAARQDLAQRAQAATPAASPAGFGRGGPTARGGISAGAGARYGRGRPSVFMVEPDVSVEEEGPADAQPLYFFTPSQGLDPRLAAECPESLEEGHQDAPRDPKFEKDLPAEAEWHGQRTMIPREDVKSQGVFWVLRNLQQHFQRENILTSRRRKNGLERMIKKDADRAQYLDMVRVREHDWGRPMTYEEARRLCLDIFLPKEWLQQTMSVWRKSLEQGPKPGSQWLANMLQFRQLCNSMIPGNEDAISDAFFALLLRAGINEEVEREISREPYEVYDAKKALQKIDEVSRRIPREGALSKAEVNRAQGVMEMDSEAVAAVKMVREMAVVNRTAVVYSGALAELMRERGISETEFQRRKQEKECVWCQSKDQFLFACPDYMANGLNQSRAQGQQQGRENYKRELQQRRVLSRADAHRHFRKTGEVAGPHAKANVVEAGSERGRTTDRARYAPVSDKRSLSRGLSTSSASSAGSDMYAFVSEDEGEAENGAGAGH